ncbi:MAG: 50S ribosomal protein L25, partial [Myxococcales bacterium]|nr:50S ribosomal protein L25 [Myxococcales bacterium]
MEFQKLEVELRKETGKGPARRLRARGRVPGVVYGRELPCTPIAFDDKQFRKALTTPYGLNTVLDLEFSEPAGKHVLAMVQDHEVHPVSRELLHVDFFTVDPNREVDVRVPLVTTGKAEGEKEGGRLLLVFREVPMRCLPAAIPVKVEVDVTPLKIGQGIKAGQLAMPAGARLTLDPMQTMVAVAAPEAEEEKKPEEVAAEEAAAAAAGAPAAPGAAP